MGRALFVSDIHIQGPADPKFQLFADFLDACIRKPPEHLFLVGDIFDLWVADRTYFVETYHSLIERLRHLKGLKTEIHYFEGNHDLDLKIFWQRQLGFDVRENAAHYRLGPFEVRVEHGDEMDPEDRGYLFLRWFLRTPLMRGLGRGLPNAAVRWIGMKASHTSRDYTSNVKTVSAEQSLAKLRVHAAKVHAEKAFDLLVSGHVHVSADFQEGGYRCINLGTWLKDPLVLVLDGEGVELRDVRQFIDSTSPST